MRTIIGTAVLVAAGTAAALFLRAKSGCQTAIDDVFDNDDWLAYIWQ